MLNVISNGEHWWTLFFCIVCKNEKQNASDSSELKIREKVNNVTFCFWAAVAVTIYYNIKVDST